MKFSAKSKELETEVKDSEVIDLNPEDQQIKIVEKKPNRKKWIGLGIGAGAALLVIGGFVKAIHDARFDSDLDFNEEDLEEDDAAESTDKKTEE